MPAKKQVTKKSKVSEDELTGAGKKHFSGIKFTSDLDRILTAAPMATRTLSGAPTPNYFNWSSTEINLSRKQLELLHPAYPAADVLNAVAFFTNQSLQRDGFVGAWAAFLKQANPDSDQVTLKFTSPDQDISFFASQVSLFYHNGTLARTIWDNVPNKPDPKKIYFSLENGLPLTTFQSIQLLHYPPTETGAFADFLYAPTITRWDKLMIQAGMPSTAVRSQERIIDIVPLVADGDLGSALLSFDMLFGEYTEAMLEQFLVPPTLPAGPLTLPVVAQGAQVRNWLWAKYHVQIEPQLPIREKPGLHTLDVFLVRVGNLTRLTPFIVSNHPSSYLYVAEQPIAKRHEALGGFPAPYDVMYQDLVCAGWNAIMAQNNQLNPFVARDLAMAPWTDDESAVVQVMTEHNMEFSYNSHGNHAFACRE